MERSSLIGEIAATICKAFRCLITDVATAPQAAMSPIGDIPINGAAAKLSGANQKKPPSVMLGGFVIVAMSGYWRAARIVGVAAVVRVHRVPSETLLTMVGTKFAWLSG